jgi:hypothetical protein
MVPDGFRGDFSNSDSRSNHQRTSSSCVRSSVARPVAIAIRRDELIALPVGSRDCRLPARQPGP